MRIIVDFVRAEQHWVPDTGVQQNFLVFSFAGMEHRIPCDEEDIIRAVRAATGQAQVDDEPLYSDEQAAPQQREEISGLDTHAGALHRMEDDAPDDGRDAVFGGDVDAQAVASLYGEPAAQEPPLREQTPTEARQAQINSMMSIRPRSRGQILDEKNKLKEAARKIPGGRKNVRPQPEFANDVRRDTAVSDDDLFSQG